MLKILIIFCILIISLAGCSFDEEITISSGNLHDCESFSDDITRKNCYIDFASKTNNVSVCSNLLEKDRAFCYSIVAIENKDLSVCDLVREYSQYCYSTFATKTNDLSICDKTDKSFKEFCYANFALKNNNIAVCDVLIGQDKLDCYVRFAGNTHNLSVCDKLNEKGNITFCYGNFAFYKINFDEEAEGFEQTCNNLSEEEEIERCIAIGKEMSEKYNMELYQLE